MPQWGTTDAANNAPKWEVAPGHRKANSALVTGASGTVTANSATANVNGVGTSFTTTLTVRALLYSNTNVLLGRVKSITNTTQAILYTPSVANVVSNGFYYAPDGILTGFDAYQNTTPDAFTAGIVEGVYMVSRPEIALREANGINNGVSPGWNLLKYGEGGVNTSVINSAATATFANNESLVISNGSINAVLNAVTNSTGGVTSFVVSTPGLFTNTAVGVANFLRQEHLNNITVTSNATAIGFANGDVIKVSNGILNATATVTTNATGGISSTAVTNPGLFGNTQANNTLVFSVSNSTGGATTGNVASTGLAGNLVTSSNTGKVLLSFTLGGHAGRVRNETLVYTRNVVSPTNTAPFKTS